MFSVSLFTDCLVYNKTMFKLVYRQISLWIFSASNAQGEDMEILSKRRGSESSALWKQDSTLEDCWTSLHMFDQCHKGQLINYAHSLLFSLILPLNHSKLLLLSSLPQNKERFVNRRETLSHSLLIPKRLLLSLHHSALWFHLRPH